MWVKHLRHVFGKEFRTQQPKSSIKFQEVLVNPRFKTRECRTVTHGNSKEFHKCAHFTWNDDSPVSVRTLRIAKSLHSPLVGPLGWYFWKKAAQYFGLFKRIILYISISAKTNMKGVIHSHILTPYMYLIQELLSLCSLVRRSAVASKYTTLQ